MLNGTKVVLDVSFPICDLADRDVEFFSRVAVPTEQRMRRFLEFDKKIFRRGVSKDEVRGPTITTRFLLVSGILRIGFISKTDKYLILVFQ